MKIFSSKKRVAAIGAITAATLVGGGMAYAYWTAEGTGVGSAEVGSTAAWTVAESPDPIDIALAETPLLAPGTGTQVHTYVVKNMGSGVQDLAEVEVSVAPGWSNGIADPLCTAADFSIGGATAGTAYSDTELAGSFAAGVERKGTFTVEMVNREDETPGDGTGNQDNCKGAVVDLVFKAS